MTDADSVGKAFLQYYYQLFESNRAGLGNLYQDGSMLTFEGQKFQGPQAIMAKLGQLPFTQCKISADTMDFQPSVSGGIMVFVTGKIIVRGLTVLKQCRSVQAKHTKQHGQPSAPASGILLIAVQYSWQLLLQSH